ncbi:SDR family NAD(P)-dependent oxidoreductase [Mesorhizobium sp. M0700]
MPSSTTKRALITGAGAADGIGFAIARQLGLAGHAVFLNGASARVLDRAAELCAEGINAKAAVADLTIAAEVARLRADISGELPLHCSRNRARRRKHAPPIVQFDRHHAVRRSYEIAQGRGRRRLVFSSIG